MPQASLVRYGHDSEAGYWYAAFNMGLRPGLHHRQ